MALFISKKWSGVMREALDASDSITPSVLAVAIVSGVKPKDLAEMLVGEEEVSGYRAEVAKHLQNAYVKRAVEMEKEAKAKEKK